MNPAPPPVLLLDADVPLGSVGLPGWTTQRGFDLDAVPWDRSLDRIICVGTVDADAAPAALEALARGAGLAVHVALQGTTRHRFLDDLHKISAPVRYEPSSEVAVEVLSDAQRDLLDALAHGATVTAAAAALHMSRRTANRVLAEARHHLGATTTADAVRRWVASRPTA
ncbi:MAG: LuxR family transcriptional regulator [Aquihabitans sp.]